MADTAASTAVHDPASAGPRFARYEVQGRELDLPLHIAHARAGVVVHTADAGAIAASLPDGLAPVETRPGRGLLVLGVVQYVDNPLGDYAEGVVASAVRPAGAPGALASVRDLLAGRVGGFVHHMPVSQAFTCEAGQRLWGFPKSVDRLELRTGQRRLGLRWATDEGEVVELSTPHGAAVGRGVPVRGVPATVFTHRDGRVWRVPLVLAGRGLAVHAGGSRLRLGTHPVADWLRGLRLSRRAVATASITHASMDFQPAVACDDG